MDNNTTESRAYSLRAHIEAGKRRLLENKNDRDGHQDGFLLLSSPQEAMPKLTFLDPVLDPADKTVFANIWIYAKEQGNQLAGFPSHRTLMSRCNIQRRQEITRALTVLRLCRWITLCEEVREPVSGAFRGNIYALHDEPAPLALVQELDHGYIRYLEQRLETPDSRIRRIAVQVSAGIDIELGDDHDPTVHDPLRVQDTRLSAFNTIRILEQQSAENPTPDQPSLIFFGIPVDPAPEQSMHNNHHVRIPNMVILGQSTEKSPCPDSEHGDFERSSSSSYIYKKTTTTTPVDNSKQKSRKSILIQPPEMTKKEYDLALHRIRNFSLEEQQNILDELGEQVRTRKDTLNPIRNSIAYLSWICQQLETGQTPLSSAYLQRQQRRERENERQDQEEQHAQRAAEELARLAKTVAQRKKQP